MVDVFCLVLLGFGSTILAQLDKLQPEGVCFDKAPEDAPFGCHRYAKLGLCNGIADQFCKKSCKRCDCSEAEALFCDVEGLMAFKNSFRKGQEYLQSWQGDDPCRGWEFITCNYTIGRVGIVEFKLINTIIQNTMSGSLVPALSKLRYLEGMRVWSVQLNGELPLEYSVLNKLKEFSLHDARSINGTLPAQYTQWTQIQFIHIFNSQITGTIPVEFSLLTSIIIFGLNENSLHGTIPPNFSMWKQLEKLNLMFNQLTGTLSKEFSEWNQLIIQDYETSMTFIVLGNKLTGSLPKEYSNLVKMSHFTVGGNRLSGSLPIEYSTWVVNEIFSVETNFLSGTLPVQYSKMKRMKTFYVNGNKFRGQLPKEYSTMIRLKNFTAFNTNLNFLIPQEWSKLQENNASIIITTQQNQYIQLLLQQYGLSP